MPDRTVSTAEIPDIGPIRRAIIPIQRQAPSAPWRIPMGTITPASMNVAPAQVTPAMIWIARASKMSSI
jgi:hypothetical protein